MLAGPSDRCREVGNLPGMMSTAWGAVMWGGTFLGG